jgi:SSS family solute:Na+ symporter
MGVEWFGLAMGLGFVLSFGYWCTDFLVVQRAMAANSMNAARRTPLIAAFPKMLFPFLVILPGMVAVALLRDHHGGFDLPVTNGETNWNMVIPVMLGHYLPTGMIGLGFTALMAAFMSGMAGNVTAFNTVWTYDIYQSYLAPGKSDRHYLGMGRAATIAGVLLSVVSAYYFRTNTNIMDLLQLVFAFVNAPLFATFLLGMFWRRTTGHGAFWGLLSGTLLAVVHHGLTIPVDAKVGQAGGWLGGIIHTYPSPMAQNFWTAIVAWSGCMIVTIAISLATARNKTDQELAGLVYSLTPKPAEEQEPWYKRPVVLGVIVLSATLVLNLIFA